jgi:hypothetical protein
MASKHGPKDTDFDSDSFDDYDDFEDELDDDLDNVKDLSKGFYSADWEDPNESDYSFSTRRKIERRKELKDLYSELEDDDELDFGKDW